MRIERTEPLTLADKIIQVCAFLKDHLFSNTSRQCLESFDRALTLRLVGFVRKHILERTLPRDYDALERYSVDIAPQLLAFERQLCDMGMFSWRNHKTTTLTFTHRRSLFHHQSRPLQYSARILS